MVTMKQTIKQKLLNNRGETLAESILSILVVTLSVILFMMVSISAASANAAAKERTKLLTDEYSSAEQQSVPVTTVEITVAYSGTDSIYTVDVFGGGSLKSYKLKE